MIATVKVLCWGRQYCELGFPRYFCCVKNLCPQQLSPEMLSRCGTFLCTVGQVYRFLHLICLSHQGPFHVHLFLSRLLHIMQMMWTVVDEHRRAVNVANLLQDT